MRSIILFCVAAATLAAQDTDSNVTRNITAASEFFDHDYVNFFAFANGVWDSRVPNAVSSTGVETYRSGLGWEAGGGITATHTFKDGDITVNYRGSYRDYQSSTSGSGQQQSLSLAYLKRLNRRWTLETSISGGILGFGSSYFSSSSLGSVSPNSPFGLESRFAEVGASLTYAQTRRLSYVFTGSLQLNSYKYARGADAPPATDSRGASGGVSVLYRLTAKTTVGATYSHSYFRYSGGAGSTNIDSGALTLSHKFPEHWQLDLSAGINRAHSEGLARVPIEFVYNGVKYLAYELIPYNRSIYSPAFQGVLTHSYRHSSFSVGGGQSILPGNGLYLASRDEFANASYSQSTRRSNFSLGFSYSRLSSISTALTTTYSSYGLSAGYGINLVRYISANLRYDLIHYDDFLTTGGFDEQRISFGLNFSSQSVPLTLY